MRDKAFNFAKNRKYDRYQWGLASIVYTFFDKKTSGSGIDIDNIWGADLAYMQLISKFNKRIRFLLRVIDIFSKYA